MNLLEVMEFWCPQGTFGPAVVVRVEQLVIARQHSHEGEERTDLSGDLLKVNTAMLILSTFLAG